MAEGEGREMAGKEEGEGRGGGGGGAKETHPIRTVQGGGGRWVQGWVSVKSGGLEIRG